MSRGEGIDQRKKEHAEAVAGQFFDTGNTKKEAAVKEREVESREPEESVIVDQELIAEGLKEERRGEGGQNVMDQMKEALSEQLAKDLFTKKKLAKLYDQEEANFSSSIVNELRAPLTNYEAIRSEILRTEGTIHRLSGKIRVLKDHLMDYGWFSKFMFRKSRIESKETRKEIAELEKLKRKGEKSLVNLKKQQKEVEKRMKRSGDETERGGAQRKSSPEPSLSNLPEHLVRRNIDETALYIEQLKSGIQKITEERDSLSRWDLTFFPWKKNRLNAEIKEFVDIKKKKEEELAVLSKEHGYTPSVEDFIKQSEAEAKRVEAEIRRVSNRFSALKDKIRFQKNRRRGYGWFSKERDELNLEIKKLEREADTKRRELVAKKRRLKRLRARK